MKKVFVLSSMLVSLYASNDYIPLSDISEDKQLEYNFKTLDNTLIDAQDVETNVVIENKDKLIPINDENNGDIIENSNEKKNQILEINNPIIKEEKQIIEKTIEPSIIKKDLILKNEIKDETIKENSFFDNKNFTITPKLTYSYLKTDNYVSGKVSVVDEEHVLMPEVAFSYKKHTLKAETMSVKTYFNGVIIGGNDLSIKNSWFKLNYLYKYLNANIGLAYNQYKVKGNFIFNNTSYYIDNEQKFPSLEVHLENEEDRIKVGYGVSYGNNSDIDYAYEYYLNLGYKIFNNDNLIISTGYKNKTIEIGNIRYQHKGPTITLGGTF